MPTAKPWATYAFAAGCVLIWSSFMLMSRLAGLSVLTPYDVLALRLLCGCAVLALLPAAPKLDSKPPRLWLMAVLSAICFPLLSYAAARWVPAAHPALLAAGMQPFMLALLLVVLGKGWPPAIRLPGYLLLALGLVLLVLNQAAANLGQWLGDGMLLLAALAWVSYGQLSRTVTISAWQLTRFVTHSATLLYLPVYLLWLPKQLHLADAATLLSQGLFHGIVPTILGMQCYLRASQLLEPAQLAGFMAWIPVVTGVLAIPLLGEPLSPLLMLALLSASLGASWLCYPRLPAFLFKPRERKRHALCEYQDHP